MRRCALPLCANLLAVSITALASAHPCLCNGDANLDGAFDKQDFQFTIDCIGHPPFNDCVNADINCDGEINADDISPSDPFGTDSAILCLWSGLSSDQCCPGHIACGSPLAGACCDENGNAACDELDCCVTVCLSDPFCCDTLWDEFCVAFARDHCALSGDCDQDSDIDLADFETLAACAGPPNGPPPPAQCCCADFDADGDTDLLDYGAFQRSFNP